MEGLQKETIEEPVQNVLMEEWEFLTSESWIASRLKRSFSAFLRAGTAAIELGGRGFDSLAAKTLKLPQFEIPKALKPRQRLRAASKWIAVGGSSAAALVHPLPAVLLSATTGLFLLFDP